MVFKKGKRPLDDRIDRVLSDQSQSHHHGRSPSFDDHDDEFDLSEKDKDMLFYVGVGGVFVATFVFAAVGLGVFHDGLSERPSKVTNFHRLIPKAALVKEPYEKKVYQACAPAAGTDGLESDYKTPLSTQFTSIRQSELSLKKSYVGARIDYLICGMKAEMERFCYASYRQQLAEQLMVFINMKRMLIKNYESFLNTPQGEMYGEMVRRMVKSGVEAPGLPKRVEAKKSIDDRLGLAFQGVMRQGYITREDFGWFGMGFPAELEPFVPGEVVEPGLCSR